jgi:hypothetical protein
MMNGASAPSRPKNLCAKTRPKDNPYEVYKNGHGWTWRILKKWQVDDKKPYARWFCFVTSPYCPSGEYGDVYVREITDNAVRVSLPEPQVHDDPFNRLRERHGG